MQKEFVLAKILLNNVSKKMMIAVIVFYTMYVITDLIIFKLCMISMPAYHFYIPKEDYI